ncbi:fasciclin arabinogalactan protein [Trifolium repens]|nr:fasciclin arabinogalactan protein [Trifolium repens]
MGSSLTLFLPIDSAFVDLPRSIALQSLASDKKILLLKGHILTVFYPLNLLQTSNISEQLTLASDVVSSAFILNISSVNETVYLRTGAVEAVITKTVFDEHPISIFGISKVLLPKEFYGKNPGIFHSPPPPLFPPMVDGKEDDGEDAGTQMWLVVLVSLDFILAVLVIYSFRLVARSVVEAVITQMVLDEHLISIFGISKVLLPKKIFGKNPMVFHSPPPPPHSPHVIDEEDDSSDVVDTHMWLVVFLSLELFLFVLVLYNMRLVARI